MPMDFCFDEFPDRYGTYSYKWDCNKLEFPQRPDATPMWVADMDFPCLPGIVKAITERAAHPIYGYSAMPAQGAELVKAWQKKRNDWDIDPAWVTYTNGVVTALSMAVRAFAAEGEGVILMSPVYYPFKNNIVHNHRALRDCPMQFDGERWVVNFALLEKLTAEPSTKLLLLCSPHNPLCRVFTREELLRIAEICLKHNVKIFSDEIHSDLIFQGHKHIPIASLSPEIADITITATAPSKTFNIAGLQMSAIITSNPELREQFTAALGFDCIASLFGVVGFMAAYGDPDAEKYVDQLTAYLWGNYEVLDRTLRDSAPGIRVLRPEATYLMWLDCRALGMDDETIERFFVEEAGIGIEMGNLFGDNGTGYVRMNIGCPRSVIESCAQRIAQAYHAHGFPTEF